MKRLLIGLLFATALGAQTPVTVTGVISDSGGNPATSGYVEFDIQPSSSSIQYYVNGVNTIAPQVVQCGIDGTGNVKNLALSGPCKVWSNDVITPANTTYQVIFAPGGNIINQVNGECIISPGPYNLSTPRFCPNVQVTPEQAIIRSNPFETNIIPNVDSVYNVGSPAYFWAAGYFRNINGATPGTVTSVGLTLPAWLTVAGSPITSAGIFGVTPTSGQTPHQVIGTCGALTLFQPCTLGVADIPGVGTVTNLVVGGLIPLFTVNVTNPSTTPNVTFSLSTFGANTVFGNCTGINTIPSVCNITTAMLPYVYQGATNKLFTCLGSFTPGHFVTTDGSGNCIDAGATGGKAVLQAPTVCNLGSDQLGLSGSSPHVIISCAATAPSSGCPCRATVSWTIMGAGSSSTQQAEGIISDGASSFAGVAGTFDSQITTGYKGITRTAYSPNLYNNNQAVTFTLTAESDHTWDVRTGSFYLNAPTQVQVTYLSGN